MGIFRRKTKEDFPYFIKESVLSYEYVSGTLSKGQTKSKIYVNETELIIKEKKSIQRVEFDTISHISYNNGLALDLPKLNITIGNVRHVFRGGRKLHEIYEFINEKVKQNSGSSELDILKKLAELKDLGVITDEEFEEKKKTLLNQI
ncbi:MAG: SHOCT domain-containing protein [Methanobacterium sp.]